MTKLTPIDTLHSEDAKKVGDVYLEPDGALLIEWHGPWLEKILETGQVEALVVAVEEQANRLREVLKRNTQ